MTDVEVALARRATQCAAWQWWRIEQTVGSPYRCDTTDDGEVVGVPVYLRSHEHTAGSDELPDLADPATRGQMLRMLTQLDGVVNAEIRQQERIFRVVGVDDTGHPVAVLGEGDSPAEAIVHALEQAAWSTASLSTAGVERQCDQHQPDVLLVTD